MEIERKWAPRSQTFVVWLVVLVLGTYLTMNSIGWFMELFGLGKYTLSLAALANIIVRFRTWQPIGEEGKRFWRSKTYWLNIVILLVCVYNLSYALYTGEKSAILPFIGAIVAYWTIWIRVNRTRTKITLLPGPLGRLI